MPIDFIFWSSLCYIRFSSKKDTLYNRWSLISKSFKIDFSNRNYSFINFIFPIPRLLDGKLILLTSFLSMIKVKKTISSKQAKFLMKKVFFPISLFCTCNRNLCSKLSCLKTLSYIRFFSLKMTSFLRFSLQYYELLCEMNLPKSTNSHNTDFFLINVVLQLLCHIAFMHLSFDNFFVVKGVSLSVKMVVISI